MLRMFHEACCELGMGVHANVSCIISCACCECFMMLRIGCACCKCFMSTFVVVG